MSVRKVFWLSCFLILGLGPRGVVFPAALRAGDEVSLDAKTIQNLFVNGSFEMGRMGWGLEKDRGVEARFSIDDHDGVDGQRCALVRVDKISGWGVQFGQRMMAGKKGDVYTFAAFAKAVDGPAAVRLQIERQAKPWDRAGYTEAVKLRRDQWTELRATFTISKDFPQGWFAYVSCTQPKCAFKLDAVRLYKGPYIPSCKSCQHHYPGTGLVPGFQDLPI